MAIKKTKVSHNKTVANKPKSITGKKTVKTNIVEPAKKNFGARTVFNYVKLQTKLAFTPAKPQSKAKKAGSWIVKAIILAVALFFEYLFVYNLTKQTNFIRGNNLLILFVTVAQLILLVYSVSIQINRLHKPNDLRIISSFPLSSFQRYLGEVLTLYIRMLFYSLVIFYPCLLVYGGAAQIGNITSSTCYIVKYPAQFIFAGLFASIFLPLFPFAFSLLISVPFMYLSNFLQNKHIAKLIIFIIIFAAILVLYALLLTFITDFYVNAKNNKEVMQAIANVLNGMNRWYNPCYYISEIALFTNVGVLFAIYLGISVVFGAAGVAITKPLYKKFTQVGSALEGVANIKSIQIKAKNPYNAIFMKEIKNILRTPSYAYFYLGVAITMPLLAYLTIDLVAKLGEATIGSNVFFGFALLTLCIILSLVGSYAANVISREGKEFYITKVTPLSYRKQLFAKASVNFIVSFIGLVLCIIVLGCTTIHNNPNKPGLTVAGLFMIFGICTLFLIGMTFNGVNIDLGRPRIDLLSGQPNESNIVIQLFIGLIIGAILSVISIVGDALFKTQQVTILQFIILGLSALYALINFLIFFFTCEKRYIRMEIK